MNYKEIVDIAKSYTDRYDEELVGAMPAFTRIVEGKINNALRTGEQSVRAQIWLKRDEEYYTLPCDWGGARDVEILKKGEQHGRTLVYLSPEEMNKVMRTRDSSVEGRHNYYTIIAGQIQVAPPTDKNGRAAKLTKTARWGGVAHLVSQLQHSPLFDRLRGQPQTANHQA